MNFTKAYLSVGDDYESPAVRADTDGCDCCSHSERFTDATEALQALSQTAQVLENRLTAIRALAERIRNLGRVPSESEK